VLLENVPGLGQDKNQGYRHAIESELHDLGFETHWRTIRACDHGVPQLRPRFVLVAIQEHWAKRFIWPEPSGEEAPTVGDTLYSLMASGGWGGAEAWREGAQRIAPTLSGNAGVTGGGPDLGQTRAKVEWETKLGTNGRGIAEAPPDYRGKQKRDRRGKVVLDVNTDDPMLTVPMTALLQGFPRLWEIQGAKTNAYRQVAEAFPPPVARVLGQAIATSLA
jgi:DNA (cytosine-5)-methyltransferase 1